MDYQIGDRLARYSDLLQGWQVGTIKAKYVGEFAVDNVLLLCTADNPNSYMNKPHVINMDKAIWPLDQVYKI